MICRVSLAISASCQVFQGLSVVVTRILPLSEVEWTIECIRALPGTCLPKSSRVSAEALLSIFILTSAMIIIVMVVMAVIVIERS